MLALLALPYTWLVLRFDWLCDDAFISFRYARNLAQGHGLIYNLGEQPPVEGFTNLLWVLWLSLFELIDARVPLVARVSSGLCGYALFTATGLFIASRTRDWRALAGALAFLATLPPLAAWTTSGLETLPFTLAVFGLFASTFAQRPRVALGAVCAVATLLLRADGFVFVAIVLGVALASARRARSRELLRAVLTIGAVAALTFVAHMLWRRAYFDAWAPNTARVKIEPGLASLISGSLYVGTFLITYPACVLVAAASLWAVRKTRDGVALAALLAAFAICGYALAVGGDFMAMGRFLIPALPLLAVAFASALAHFRAGRSGVLASTALVLACSFVSLLAAFDVHVAPAALRERLRFRWNTNEWFSEWEQWHMMQLQAQKWRLLGRALHAHSQPGDSIVIGTIGAVGYYSGMTILDPYGLVSREPFEELDPSEPRSPGHQRRVALATHLARNPTFLEAQVVQRDELFAGLRRDIAPAGMYSATAGPYADVAVPEWLEIKQVPGASPSQVLRVVRYRPK